MAPGRPRNPRLDDDLDLDVELEEELVDDFVDPPTEETPLPPPPPPPRVLVATELVLVLQVEGSSGVASAGVLAGLVDRIREADAAAAALAPEVAPTAVGLCGRWLVLRTPCAFEGVGDALGRQGRLAALAIGEGLATGLRLHGAVAWGHVAAGDGLVLGPALDEALGWDVDDLWIGVVATPSVALATSGAPPPGWARVGPDDLGDGLGLVWLDDVAAAARTFATLGPLDAEDAWGIEQALAFLTAAVTPPGAETP